MRGLEREHEQNPHVLLRDTRTVGQKISHFFVDRYAVLAVLAAHIGVVIFFPEICDIALIVGVFIYSCAINHASILPFRIPKHAHLKDFGDCIPGTKKPNFSKGISYFGNEIKTGQELWFSNEDMRTHCLLFGSTGSGKTETLISIAFNALVQGSGFIYVDGKGDNSLFAKIFSMVRRVGREDDLLIINFMTGAKDIVGVQKNRLSNTMNPFATGSSSMLSQLVISLMNDSSGSDGDMWKGRAIVFVEALMRVLVYMRDQGHILLDSNITRSYFELHYLEMIAINLNFPIIQGGVVDISHIPRVVLEPITNYLINLPGYDRSKVGKQSSQVMEQHGYVTMQLTRVFGSLSDTYGHILRTNLAEVDIKDVVLNRRILVVLLPAFEKSISELSNLGKIIVSSLKSMLAAGLGEAVEGSYEEIVQQKPTHAETPFLCILDEYGHYAVEGFAVVPAQARSLGFSLIFAGQDLPAFQKASKEEALSIGANCNIKICMKLEDPMETWDFFSKTAGDAWVTKVDAFQTKPDSLTNSYMDTKSASSEKRARIDLLDLKEQDVGEAHILFKSKIIRARMFYADPKPVKVLKLNQFLKINKPHPVQMKISKHLSIPAIETLSDHTTLQHIADQFESVKTSSFEAAIYIVETLKQFQEVEDVEIEDIPHLKGVIHIFSEIADPESIHLISQNQLYSTLVKVDSAATIRKMMNEMMRISAYPEKPVNLSYDDQVLEQYMRVFI